MHKPSTSLPPLEIQAIRARTEAKGTELEANIASYREQILINLNDATVHIQLGEALIKRALKGDKNVSEAVAILTRAVELAPNSAEAYTLLGAAYTWSTDHESASAAYNRALELDPSNAAAIIQIALQHSSNGQYAEALQLYDRAIAHNPNLARPHYEKATLLNNIGQPRQALVHLDQAAKVEPNNPVTYSRRGLILASRNLIDQATGAFEEAVKLDSQSADHWFNLAMSLMMFPHRLQEAADIFEKLTEVHPTPATVQLYLGQTQYLLSNDNEAEKAYRRSIEIEPTTTAYYGLAHIYLRKNDNVHTLAHLNAALALAGINPNMRSAEIEICKKILGMLIHPDSIDTRILGLRKLIELDPNNPSYYLELARALETAGRFKEAIEALNKVLVMCEQEEAGRAYIPNIQGMIALLEAQLQAK